MERIAPWLQTNWDVRAAGNFIGGGTGSGLAIAAAAATLAGRAVAPLDFVAAAVFIAAGLGLVWLEIGRPWRFLHVFFNPRTSWMTRESLVAPPLLAALGAAFWFGGALSMLAVAVLAAGFLYTQSRILRAATGIPAWREPRIVPLIVATGLAEGVGALAVLTPWTMAPPAIIVVLALVALRWLAWRSYRARVMRGPSPAGTRKALKAMAAPFLILATVAPLTLFLVALAWPGAAPVSVVIGGLACMGGGWLLKFTVVTRAAFNQGFSLPHTPTLGAGAGGPPMRPGWS